MSQIIFPPLYKKSVSKSHINLKNNILIKSNIKNIEAEIEKYETLYSASTEGSFIAPKIVDCDKKSGSISFEHIESLQSIRCVYLNYMRSSTLNKEDFHFLVKTGTVLAEIHEALKLQQSAKWGPSQLFQQSFLKNTGLDIVDEMKNMPWSIAHCDFGFSNIQFISNAHCEKKLVILDPSVNGYVTTKTNLMAPVYVDLANLISCIHGLVPIGNYPAMHWKRVPPLIDSIISAYNSRSNIDIDTNVLGGMVYANSVCKFKAKYRFPYSTLAIWLLFTRLKGFRFIDGCE